MKKTMSRLLAVALVLAMVCAMIPAAMAAVTGVTVTADRTALTVGDATTGKAKLTASVAAESSDDKTVTWAAYTTADGTTVSDVVSLVPNDSDNTVEVTAVKAGTAYVVATSDGDATKKSSATTITVTAAPTPTAELTFTTQPVSTSYVQNATATALSVATTGGYGTTTYQWYSAADISSEGTLLTDQNAATYTPSTATVGTVYYYCVATSTDGKNPMTATSTRAAISVTAAPVQLAFTTQPVAATYVQNATPTALSVATTGGYGTVTYKWYSAADTTTAGTELAGQTGATFTPSTKTVGTNYYYCVATSEASNQPTMTATSERAAITVTAQAYTLALTVSPSTIKIDGSATVTATVKTAAGTAYTGTEKVTFGKTGGYVELKSTSTALSGGTATTTVTGLSKGTSTIKATVTIGSQTLTQTANVTVSGIATAKTINYESDSEGYAYFDGYDFYKAVRDASSSTLSYVKFTSQYGGTLYRDDSSTSNSNKVTMDSTRCYYEPSSSSSVDLDDLVFIIDDAKKSHYVDYSAYTSSGTEIATGRVTIDGDGSSDGDVTYYVSSEETVTLSESDFEDFFTDEYSNGTLEYVKFAIGDASNYGTSSYGYLYESDETKASKVSSSSKYYFEATSKQDDLDTVEFRAGTKSSAYTVKIPFTAYGTDKNDRSRNTDGTLVIEVNSTKSVSITTDGDTFTNLKLVKTMQPKNVSSSKLDNYYVMFDKVTNGTLYSYYKSASNSEQYGKRDKYWFNPDTDEYDLGDVFFLPKSNAKTAEVRYTLYKTTGSSKKNGTEVDTGKILFKVEQGKVTAAFNDIPANVKSWAGEAVDYMAKQGYISGTANKTFSPNANMSRAMLVTVLYRMAGEPSVSNISNPFTDVAKGQYYYNAVLWAYNKGIVTGKGANKFAPNASVTREEIAAFLYRYAGKPVATGTLTGFTDYTRVSTFATDAMKWAVKNEIIAGIGGKISPKTSATRAQVATMLYRYINK